MDRAAETSTRFSGFPQAVFQLFEIPDFAGRMARLRQDATPRLRDLGGDLAEPLSALAGEPLYPHVALHMRRRVNPPEDTWVAWGRSPRGYKSVLHFEVGVSVRGVFAWLVVKPEGQAEKPALLDGLTLARIRRVGGPDPLFWYGGEHGEGAVAVGTLDEPAWQAAKERARHASRSVVFGFSWDRTDPRLGAPVVRDVLLSSLTRLAPLYRSARAAD